MMRTLDARVVLEILMLTFLLLPSSACRRQNSGPRAYVSNERDGTISVIDLQTNQVVSSIKVGGRPRGIRIGPDNKTIWVAVSYPSNQQHKADAIAVVNTD